ncbi:hypothetical protein SAMN06272771_0219 [Streptomyces sp. Ag82_O1-12]|nr:hypothetical protein SAMN06272771_0219 [Streptomyces sp. Ag82_O1-12]SOD42967.1 hypothetical protein SAMN06272727_0209 [Streptomyces sp. Ag82_G6-1]
MPHGVGDLLRDEPGGAQARPERACVTNPAGLRRTRNARA